MRILTLFTATILAPAPALVSAGAIDIQFTGSVLFAAAAPYGATISAQTAISGSFLYDPTSLQTHTISGAAGYEQHFADGLIVNFGAGAGAASVHADDYIVQVANNVAQPGGGTADVLTVLFRSNNLSPALTQPLVVNGIPESVGVMSLNFSGPNSLWNDTTLPPWPPLIGMAGQSIFSHLDNGSVDVLSNVRITAPEPSTFILALCPVMVWACARCRALKRRNC